MAESATPLSMPVPAYNVGDKVIVRSDLFVGMTCDIEEFGTGEAFGLVSCSVKPAEFAGEVVTICFVDIDEPTKRIWYACEETDYVPGDIMRTDWWVYGNFEGLYDESKMLDVDECALDGVLDM